MLLQWIADGAWSSDVEAVLIQLLQSDDVELANEAAILLAGYGGSDVESIGLGCSYSPRPGGAELRNLRRARRNAISAGR